MLITTSCSFLVNDWRHHQNLCHEQDKSARTSGLQGIDILHVGLPQPEHQRLIADAGALPLLIGLLRRQASRSNNHIAYGVVC